MNEPNHRTTEDRSADPVYPHPMGGVAYPGLTKRELFSLVCLHAIMTGPLAKAIADQARARNIEGQDAASNAAVEQADALLVALEKAR